MSKVFQEMPIKIFNMLINTENCSCKFESKQKKIGSGVTNLLLLMPNDHNPKNK
jgi:hypothetical protein